MEYLHSDIDAIERVEILRRLRKGEFDVLVGVNLLREGLDLPEVALVAILDAHARRLHLLLALLAASLHARLVVEQRSSRRLLRAKDDDSYSKRSEPA